VRPGAGVLHARSPRYARSSSGQPVESGRSDFHSLACRILQRTSWGWWNASMGSRWIGVRKAQGIMAELDTEMSVFPYPRAPLPWFA
jgi:hypothetical protein